MRRPGYRKGYHTLFHNFCYCDGSLRYVTGSIEDCCIFHTRDWGPWSSCDPDYWREATAGFIRDMRAYGEISHADH